MTGAVHATPDQAARVLDFAALSGSPQEVLERVNQLLAGNERGLDGVAKLRELFSAASRAGAPPERIALDVSIARGLDYYTGTIYETFLGDLPQIGSVCSGGRYDNLAGLFTRQPLPGVGASLGLDRLLAAMEELGLIASASTPAPVLVVLFDESRVGEYLRIARVLRQSGIGAEVYPQAKGLKKQLQYADKKGFRVAVIAGETEFASSQWQVKDLQAQQQHAVLEPELAATIRSILAS
jgi:histidyl-tRNA synthetase